MAEAAKSYKSYRYSPVRIDGGIFFAPVSLKK